MLFNEIKKVIKELNNKERFHRIGDEKSRWIYDSYSHNIYFVNSKLIKEVGFKENWNSFLEGSIDENLDFLNFCKSIKNSSEDIVNPIPVDSKCSVMINTSNRCNLNCSYCYRCKNEASVNNVETIKKTLDFAMKKYKPDASEYVISYSMTSESSLDLQILKQVADEYINYENYQFDDTDFEGDKFNDFYFSLKEDFGNNQNLDFPKNNKREVVDFLNSLLPIRNLFEILNLSESIFSENDINEIRKRNFLAKWRVYRLNRWCLEKKYNKYIKIRKVPWVSFWFMTNGTCASDEFIDFVKACDINPLWVSIDGPQKVHDANRKTLKGNESYDEIVKNIKILKSKGLNLKASSVITSVFPKPLLIINHLLALGFNEVALTPVRPGYECSFYEDNIDALLDGYDEVFTALAKGALRNDFRLFRLLKDDLSLNAFNAFSQKIKMAKRCPFDDQLVVNSKGDIYPCLYFTGNKNFCYGNIYKRFNRKQFSKNLYITSRGECKECWARYLCGGTCFYGSYAATDNYLSIDPIECKLKKHLAEKCLKLIVFLYEHNIPIERVFN